MCLFTKQKRNLTAKEDIVVYKVLREDLTSPYQDFQYEAGKLYKAKIGRRGRYEGLINFHGVKIECFSIYKGLHSYYSLHDAMVSRLMFDSPARIIREAVIPRGSRYCYGLFGDIVSDQLIIKEVL